MNDREVIVNVRDMTLRIALDGIYTALDGSCTAAGQRRVTVSTALSRFLLIAHDLLTVVRTLIRLNKRTINSCHPWAEPKDHPRQTLGKNILRFLSLLAPPRGLPGASRGPPRDPQ